LSPASNYDVNPLVPEDEAHRAVDSDMSPALNNDVNPLVPEDVDTLMAQLMAHLSVHEREEVYHDLHGIADEVVETPQMIDEAITKMELALSNMSEGVEAYQPALAQDSSFVLSYKSLLCFLRAERFDAARAATRLVKFYSLKLSGFGVEKLTKDIYQEDLTQEDEREGMYDSMTHVLPFRDRAGRSIIFKLGSVMSTTPIVELVRRGVYAGLSHSRDEENQRKGMAFVNYLVGDEYEPEKIDEQFKINQHWGRLAESLPMRVTAFHFCYSSTNWRPVTSTYRMSVDSFTGLRTMVRDFETMIKFDLCSFGCVLGAHQLSLSDCRSILVTTRRYGFLC